MYVCVTNFLQKATVPIALCPLHVCGRVVRTKSKIIYSVDVLVHMSPALNGSSVSQHFEHSNMVEIHNLNSKYTELSEH